MQQETWQSTEGVPSISQRKPGKRDLSLPGKQQRQRCVESSYPKKVDPQDWGRQWERNVWWDVMTWNGRQRQRKIRAIGRGPRKILIIIRGWNLRLELETRTVRWIDWRTRSPSESTTISVVKKRSTRIEHSTCHGQTYLLGRVLNEIGKEVRDHIGSEGSCHGAHTSKSNFGWSHISRSGLEALVCSVEKVARGTVEQHVGLRN